jgi:hypothetical protein
MVYVFRSHQTGLIKIGVTEDRTFDKRLKELQTGSPDILTCVDYRDDWSYAEEKIIHEKFKHLRHHGEWFSLDDKFVEFLMQFRTMNLKISKKDIFIEKQIKLKNICPECNREFSGEHHAYGFCSKRCNILFFMNLENRIEKSPTRPLAMAKSG